MFLSGIIKKEKLIGVLALLLLNTLIATADNKPNVIIRGKLINTTSAPAVIIEKDCFAFQIATTYTCTINPDSTFSIKFYLAVPQPVHIINQTAFVEPGDSVFITISGKGVFPKMVFEGVKA